MVTLVKFPKNKANIYLVVREDKAVVGAFVHLEDADAFASACEQELLDKTGKTIPFHVQITTIYT